MLFVVLGSSLAVFGAWGIVVFALAVGLAIYLREAEFLWPSLTSYLAVVGANTAWAGDKPTKLADFGKNASTTILLVEVTHSGIAWAEPKDVLLEAIGGGGSQSGTPALASEHGRREGFFVTYDYGACIHVAMADGRVQLLRLGNRSPEELRKLLQIGGCKEEEEIGSQGDFYGETRRLNGPNIAALAVWLLSVGRLPTQAVRSRKVRSVQPTPLAR